jgi:hypothetical protein
MDGRGAVGQLGPFHFGVILLSDLEYGGNIVLDLEVGGNPSLLMKKLGLLTPLLPASHTAIKYSNYKL